MKKIILTMAIIICSVYVMAQAPVKMTYQSVIRNEANQLVANQSINMQISILNGYITGAAVYTETHLLTTNSNGLVSLEIGGGNVVDGSLSTIDWSQGTYFIKTETDPTGGTNYTITGTSQLLSVPYALYAQKAGNGFSADYNDLTNKPDFNGSETKIIAGTNATVTGNGTTESPYVVNATGLTPGTIAGQMQYWDGSAWVNIAPGINLPGNQAQTLCLCKGIPTWGPCPADIAAITSAIVTSVLATTATCGGTVTNDGGATVTARGVCWSTSAHPTIANSKTSNSTGTGVFTSNLTGLTAATTYYVRAYATNSAGTSYGSEVSFTTQSGKILMLTFTATSIKAYGANVGGNITNDGGSPVTERGVLYSTTPNVLQNLATATKLSNGTGTGSFSIDLSVNNLTRNTKYYVVVYAINSVGTSYGTIEISFTTSNGIPLISTKAASSIRSTTAVSGGTITNDGGVLAGERGICWSKTANPTTSLTTKVNILANGTGTYTCNLTGLTKNTTYHLRSYVINEFGTFYGDDLTFTTQNGIAIVSADSAANVTATTAGILATILSDGGGTITNSGFYFGQDPNFQNPGIVTLTRTSGGLGYSMGNLNENTTYYYKAYVMNEYGTFWSAVMSFKTKNGVMSIITKPATTLLSTSVVAGIEILNDGGGTVLSRGICWSTSPSPVMNILGNDYLMDNTTTTIPFKSWKVTGLLPGTTYYLRAFATNNAFSLGYQYGDEISFKTLDIPTLSSTNAASAITGTTATSGGNITTDGASEVTVRGLCWNVSGNPTIADSKTTDGGTGTGLFTSNMTGLIPGTVYYVRAYATNAIGTAYGSQVSFLTPKATYTIGETLQGGKIAYIYQSGDPGYVAGETHGIIVAPSAQSGGVIWGDIYAPITGADGTALGTGKQNTIDIVTTQSLDIFPLETSAAQICNNLVLNGYNDWWLPSIDELKKLYLNRTAIGLVLVTYWSSSETTTTANASVFSMIGGYTDVNPKSTSRAVIAIRYF